MTHAKSLLDQFLFLSHGTSRLPSSEVLASLGVRLEALSTEQVQKSEYNANTSCNVTQCSEAHHLVDEGAEKGSRCLTNAKATVKHSAKKAISVLKIVFWVVQARRDHHL